MILKFFKSSFLIFLIFISLLIIFEIFCYFKVTSSHKNVRVSKEYLPLLKYSKISEKELRNHFSNINEMRRKFKGLREYHPNLIYIYKPNLKSETYWINSYGLLDDEPDLSKKQILLIGSSVAGGGLRQNYGENIDHYLEKFIDKQVGSNKYEVLNAAIGGYSSTQEYTMMHLLSDKIKLDKAIYFSGYNDINARYRVRNLPELRSYDLIHSKIISDQVEDNKLLRSNPIISIYIYLKKYFIKSLYSYKFLSQIIANKMLNDDRTIVKTELTSEDNTRINEIVKNYLSNVEKMIILAKSKNIDLYVGIQPTLQDKKFKTEGEIENLKILFNSYGYKYKLYYNKAYPLMMDGLKMLKLKYPNNITLVETLSMFNETKIDIYRDNVHFLDYANEMVAEKIFSSLRVKID